MATMHVEVVSVEAAIWSGEASMVVARTSEGEIGVLPGHSPLLGALEPGWTVKVVPDSGADLLVAVHGGFLSVRPDGVSVLAEVAEPADDVDVPRAREALRRAESDDTPDTPDGRAARNRALARLRAAGESV